MVEYRSYDPGRYAREWIARFRTRTQRRNFRFQNEPPTRGEWVEKLRDLWANVNFYRRAFQELQWIKQAAHSTIGHPELWNSFMAELGSPEAFEDLEQEVADKADIAGENFDRQSHWVQEHFQERQRISRGRRNI